MTTHPVWFPPDLLIRFVSTISRAGCRSPRTWLYIHTGLGRHRARWRCCSIATPRQWAALEYVTLRQGWNQRSMQQLNGANENSAFAGGSKGCIPRHWFQRRSGSG